MVDTQVIKTHVDIFDNFIKQNLYKEEMYYVFDRSVYNKLMYTGKIEHFLIELKTYYHSNKQFYINRKPMSYNHFNTVIRQICRRNDTKLNHIVKYRQSKYETEYHIFIAT